MLHCLGHPDCLMCSGEACNLCGAGCWSNVTNCQHGVLERHMEPQEPDIEAANASHNDEPPCSERA